VTEFLRRVEVGEIPQPAFAWGRGYAVWDLDQVDLAMDKRSGIDRGYGRGDDGNEQVGSDPFLEALR
jgi:hypothetical protein